MFGVLLYRFELEFFHKSGRAHNHLLSEYYEAKNFLANPGGFRYFVFPNKQDLVPSACTDHPARIISVSLFFVGDHSLAEAEVFPRCDIRVKKIPGRRSGMLPRVRSGRKLR